MVFAFAPLGIGGKIVQIEVEICGHFPSVDIIGLPSSEVREARERVKAAIKNSGFSWPQRRILINLAPADVRKQGSGFDLPIAMAILVATQQVARPSHPILALGELQLNGAVRPVHASLSAAITGLEQGIEHFVLHQQNFQACKVTGHGRYHCVETLKDMQNGFRWKKIPKKKDSEDENVFDALNGGQQLTLLDLSHCNEMKRAVQVAAAGRHNILFSGPPGTGKTACALRIASLLPKLSLQASLELSALYSQSGDFLSEPKLIEERPVRVPHHTASVEGTIGSSTTNSLGEISLAHHGVLLLDEAPEFKAKVLQALREPLDQHQVLISRVGQKLRCPADFQLVLTTNLCPCGNLGKPRSSNEWCLCSEQEIFRYWKKIGAALWDRIDLKCAAKYRDLRFEEDRTHRVHDFLERRVSVLQAAKIQKERYKEAGIKQEWNSRCPCENIGALFRISKDARSSMESALIRLGISERRKIVLQRVSQTIADLSQDSYVCTAHIEEALGLVDFKPFALFTTKEEHESLS